jgi:hypothetical protein
MSLHHRLLGLALARVTHSPQSRAVVAGRSGFPSGPLMDLSRPGSAAPNAHVLPWVSTEEAYSRPTPACHPGSAYLRAMRVDEGSFPICLQTLMHQGQARCMPLSAVSDNHAAGMCCLSRAVVPRTESRGFLHTTLSAPCSHSASSRGKPAWAGRCSWTNYRRAAEVRRLVTPCEQDAADHGAASHVLTSVRRTNHRPAGGGMRAEAW